jgi:lipopolysaccharide exporter
VTLRASDPSQSVSEQPTVVAASPPHRMSPTGGNSIADRLETNGAKHPFVVPPPAPDSGRAAVGATARAFGSDRQDPRQCSPFAHRKVVPAGTPTDPGGRDAGVGVGQAALPEPRATAPTSSGATNDIDPSLESTDVGASGRHRATAIGNGLRWTMVGRPVIEGVNLLSFAVLARLVVPAEFGRYAIALIVLLLAAVPSQAIHYSIVQRNQIDRDHLKTGVTLTILIGLAICAFCFAASYTIVPILFGARTGVLVRLMIPACFINSVNTVQYAIITRRLEFRRLSVLDMTITLVGAAVSIPLAVLGLNGVAMVLGVVAGSLAGFILICVWVLPPIPNFHRGAAREILRKGIPAASNAASLVGFQNCDYVIVGARLGAAQAGYYFRAYTLSVVYQTKVSQVVNSVGFPVMSRVTAEDEVDRLRQRMIHTITLILFPLLTALAIVAPKFVTWFYGPAWHPAVVPVQILAIGGAAMLVAQAVTVAMLGAGRAKTVQGWGWGHFLVYGGAVFAVARLGLTAIAVAAVVVHTIFLIIAYVLLARGSVARAFKALAKDVLPAAACSVGFAAVAFPVSVLASTAGVPMLPYLLLVTVSGGAGYFLSLRLWFPTELHQFSGVAARLLPARVRRVLGRFAVQPQTQSAG